MKKTNDEHILFAYKFNGNGSGDKIANKAIGKELKAKNLAWVHLDGYHADTKEWLKKELDYLDDIIIDALMADETRPRLIEYGKGAVIILRGANFNENADPEDMISVRLYIDESRIISIRRRPLRSAKYIAEQLDNGIGPKDAGDFIAAFSSNLFERMDPLFDIIEDKINEAENEVMEKPSPNLRSSIVDIRKETMVYKRYISPQRDVMNTLYNSSFNWLDNSHKRKIREVYDRVWRYMEELDSLRERAQIVKDELTNSLSDKLNRNLYFLSVISAIFLPLGFFTGLLGINVGGIPGTDNPNAFMIFSLILAAIVIVQITIFKILKWF